MPDFPVIFQFIKTKTTPLASKTERGSLWLLNFIFNKGNRPAGSRSTWVKRFDPDKKAEVDVLLINDYTSNKIKSFNFYQAGLIILAFRLQHKESVSQLSDELPTDFYDKKNIYIF